LGTKKLNENNRGKYNKKQVNSVRFWKISISGICFFILDSFKWRND
jgi:hypothetical protein